MIRKNSPPLSPYEKCKFNRMRNKFKAGDIVQAIINPELKLVIRRYVKRIYYCIDQENPDRNDLVYFERELKPG